MKCPFCNGEMTEGYIYGDRYKLKWLPQDKPLRLGMWATDAIPLGEGGGFGRPRVEAAMCQQCNKIIIDVY